MRRLAARLRELALGGASGPAQDPGDAPPSSAPEPPPPAPPDRAEDAAARLDAARRRLRSSITPRGDDDGDGDSVR